MSLSRKAFIGAACALLASAGAAQAAEDSMDTVLGKALFERLWVSAPSSTKAADGLGPLFNARACSSCHQGGGRAAVSLQEGGLPASAGLTLRVGAAKDGVLVPHPILGSQVQTFAVPGLRPESKLHITFETHTETLSDGTTVELRRPRIRIDGQDQLADLAWISPRLAPDLHGGGLLERVPLTWLAEQADPDDLDSDGISGAVVMGQYGEQDIEPGRFGWKGDEPDLAHQVSAAFHFDLGLSTPLRRALWGDCTAAQPDCRAAPQGADKGGVEVETTVVALVATYLRSLPAPAASPDAIGTDRGRALFAEVGCGACHNSNVPAELATGGTTWFTPYTDLLIHDMGDGLADHAFDDSVSTVAGAHEWRTAPLWGLGARVAAKEGANLLHDGRARSVLEAILWHGGEAASAKQRAAELSAEDRASLIAFLESL
jgi:CxxC motif-containing protein (DUF1111 family)